MIPGVSYRDAKKIRDEVRAAWLLVHAERCRKWHADHPDLSSQSSQSWRERHPEDNRLAGKLWRFFNKERIRQYNLAWRARNPNYQKELRARKRAAQ